jgi:hypothetical protein
MSKNVFNWVPIALLALACHAPHAAAQTQSQSQAGASERLHANALASFRQARFSEAYGRLMALADAGHARSAEVALWMYMNGPTLFGKDWDSSQEQLTAWAQLAGQPAPTMVGVSYPKTVVAFASRTRRSAP